MSQLSKIVLASIAGLILIVFGFVWFSGKDPIVRLAKPIVAVGNDTPVVAQVDDPHGIKSFAAYLEQGGQRQSVFEDKTKSQQPSRIFNFSAGRKSATFLKEGPARFTVEAKSNDMRGSTATLAQDVQVVLRPPSVVADGLEHLLNTGGSELVTLDLGGAWIEAGVKAGKYVSGTFPMPGQPDNSTHRFSLFAYPWDLPADTIPVGFARNVAGTEVTASFRCIISNKHWRKSDINLKESDMRKVVGELDPEGTEDIAVRFVKLNRDMRKVNNQQIYDLHTKTENKILWSGPFVPMKGARESYFADDRSYFYQGKKIDEETHLGFDLAQKTNMSVTAANSGKVIWADRLGIYGNCVIIDHGYSLQSLYGHLSKIDVKVGDSIEKLQHIGVSGSTGMAFGDHIHFSMMVAGYPINPIEWWDEHWIHDRVLSKIGPNATAATSSSSATPTSKRKRPRS